MCCRAFSLPLPINHSSYAHASSQLHTCETWTTACTRTGHIPSVRVCKSPTTEHWLCTTTIISIRNTIAALQHRKRISSLALSQRALRQRSRHSVAALCHVSVLYHTIIFDGTLHLLGQRLDVMTTTTTTKRRRAMAVFIL